MSISASYRLDSIIFWFPHLIIKTNHLILIPRPKNPRSSSSLLKHPDYKVQMVVDFSKVFTEVISVSFDDMTVTISRQEFDLVWYYLHTLIW